MNHSTDSRSCAYEGRFAAESSTVLELIKACAPDGTHCARLQGVVDVEILRRALMELAALCAREEGKSLMLDLHDVESRWTLIDVHSLGEELGRLGFQPAWRMAIVGLPVTGAFACFQTIAESYGMKVRFFKDLDGARDWLRTDC